MKRWVDTTVKSKKQALVSGLPTGITQHARKWSLLFVLAVNRVL